MSAEGARENIFIFVFMALLVIIIIFFCCVVCSSMKHPTRKARVVSLDGESLTQTTSVVPERPDEDTIKAETAPVER